MRRTFSVITVILASHLMTAHAMAQGELRPFTHESTVNDFALECQHPIKKSHGSQRVALCVSYINAAVMQIALTKRSPQCWAELEAGKAAPGPVMDVLFYLASQPGEGKKPLASELRAVVTEVAAKACK
jgi:hypothetical protein